MATIIVREPFAPRRGAACFCGSGERFKHCCGKATPDRRPPHGVHIVPSVLDRGTCARWVAYFESQRREAVQIIDHHRSTPGNIVYRADDTRVTDRVHAGALGQQVIDLLRECVTGTIAAATGRRFAWFIGPQLLRYRPGGFYGRHADSDHYSPEHRRWVKGLDRDISLLVYLNEDFGGGELAFTHFDYRYAPRTGDLLFFPSDHRYLHEALPVTSGIRFVIASWAAYADEPRVRDRRPENRVDLDG